MESSYSFRPNFSGRIANISLSPSANNSLAPLYEAITNAIHAVEDKFGKDNLSKGRIDVEVQRSDDDGSRPVGFIVRDNGIGFTDDNLNSFIISDSRYKIARGGKGVGRFLWLKVFDSVKVQSIYGADDPKGITFDFVLADEDQVRHVNIGEMTG